MKGDRIFIVLFLMPAALITGVFLYYPFFRGIMLSFYQTEGFFSKTFAGFYNYIRLFQDEVVRIATLNSLELMIYAVFLQVGIALVLAVMVDSIQRGKSFFRISFFFPVVISGSAIGLLFTLIYSYRSGLLNNVLTSMGFERVLWLTEKTSLIGVAVPTIWQYVGFYFVILFTSILKVPDEFYEAAKIEGISGIKKMVHITIPLIWGDIKICMILAITGAFRVFELVYIITLGGPGNSSEVLGTYMYETTFTKQAVGYGSTIAVYIVVLGVTLSLLTNRLLKREEVTY